MNYIEQLNAFDDWLLANYLSGNAKLLWYRLMSINNRNRWQEWFQITNQRLQDEIDVACYDTFSECRKELKDKGLIEYREGKKNSPPYYRLISVSKLINGEITRATTPTLNGNEPEITSETTGSLHGDYTEIVPKISDESANNDPNNVGSPIIRACKPNQTKRNETKLSKNLSNERSESVSLDYEMILDFWNTNCRNMPKIKSLSATRRNKLRSLVKNHEQTQEMILENIIRAAKSDFLNGYTDGAWKANFDWFVKPGNYTKVSEGNYDNRKPVRQGKSNALDVFKALGSGAINLEGVNNESTGIKSNFDITPKLLS